VQLPGVPLGAFDGTVYDELSFALHAGDVFVFCTDGVHEAMNARGQEFTAERVVEVVRRGTSRLGTDHRGRHLRRRDRLEGRRAAERRHDGCRRQDDAVADWRPRHGAVRTGAARRRREPDAEDPDAGGGRAGDPAPGDDRYRLKSMLRCWMCRPTG
jgi:hypothetical protein